MTKLGGHLKVWRNQEVRSQEALYPENWVRDQEGQAEHKVRRLAKSGIQELRPELGQVSRGSGRTWDQEASQVRYLVNLSESVAAQSKGAEA